MADRKASTLRVALVAGLPVIVLGVLTGAILAGVINLGGDFEEAVIIRYGLAGGAFFLSLLLLRFFLRRQSESWNLDGSSKHRLVEKDTVAPEIQQTIDHVDRFLWTGQGEELVADMKGTPHQRRVTHAVRTETPVPPRALSPMFGLLSRLVAVGIAVGLVAVALTEVHAPRTMIATTVVVILAITVYVQQFHPFGGPRWVRPVLSTVGVVLAFVALSIGTGVSVGRMFAEMTGAVARGDYFALIPIVIMLALLLLPLLHLSERRKTVEGKFLLENSDKSTVLNMAADELRRGIQRAALWGLAWALAFIASTAAQFLVGGPIDPLLFIVRMVPAFLVFASMPAFLRSFMIRIETGPRLRRLRHDYARRSKKIQHALRPNP